MATNVEQLNQVIEAEIKKIYYHCRLKFANKADAEDAAHVAIEKAWAAAQKKQEGEVSDWRAYLWRIVNNTIIDIYRYNGRYEGMVSIDDFEEQRIQKEISYEEFNTNGMFNGATRKLYASFDKRNQLEVEPDYATDLHNKIKLDILNYLINNNIHEQHARVLKLYFFEGYSINEISAAVFENDTSRSPEIRTKAIIHRGRAQLRRMISGKSQIALQFT